MSRQNCDYVYVLNTEEGLLSCIQMYSTGVCYVLFRWDMARGGQQFKESVSWVWGVQSAFLSSVPHSGGVKFLEAGQRGTDNPLSSPDSPL